MDLHRLSALTGVFAIGVGFGPARPSQPGIEGAQSPALAHSWPSRAMASQDTAAHRFEALADGGRIVLQRGNDDAGAIDTTRRHLREIAEALQSTDRSRPVLTALGDVPGLAAMEAMKDRIRYVYRDLPRGGELQLVASDAEAVRAIHQFINHHRTGHHPPHGPGHHPPHGGGGHPPHHKMSGDSAAIHGGHTRMDRSL